MADAATSSPPAAKPAHVPDSLVYDFDYFLDAALVANPHARILDLVKKAPPVFWTPRQGGHWMLLSHAANFKAARDWESFSNEVIPQTLIKAMLAAMPPGTPHFPQPIPINVDPPEHAKYRTPLQAAFSPKAMAALQGSIKLLAEQLVEKIRKAGRCEFMGAVAEPLPVQIFLKLMGLPLERQSEYRAMVRELLSSGEFDPSAAAHRLQRVAASMRETLLARRDQPKDDLISALWKIKIDGREATLDDMENYGVLLFIAGLDTVMNSMGFGFCHLARDLPLQDKLRREPALIPEAVEELLRRYSFVVPPRRIAKDIEFEGAQMKEGERAMLFLPAADLDPAEFPNPAQFDLERKNKVHIAFNAGPHRCLGSHLARIELQTLYEVMLARLPPFQLDPDHPPKFHGGLVIGVDQLHLVWET